MKVFGNRYKTRLTPYIIYYKSLINFFYIIHIITF